jgi:hypothetical protein
MIENTIVLPDTAGVRRNHWLILCCNAWRRDNVHRRDPRKLGIPILSVELEPPR